MTEHSGARMRYGYWCYRGLGQTSRYLLKYADIDYEERTYNFGENHDNRQDWLKEKIELDLHFPNLPYLIVGDKKITQSLAILRFLGRKSGLVPETEDAMYRVDMMEQQTDQIWWELIRKVCYNNNCTDAERTHYVDNFLTNRCSELDKFLGDHEYFGGDKLTYVDFLAYEMFDQHRTLWPEYEKMYQKHAKIEAFLKRMEALPKFAKILASEDNYVWPVWSERASFGGIRSPPPKKKVKY